MRQYELTYLVSDSVSESDLTSVTGKIGGYISDEGGKVLKEESWGRRKLAYAINKQLFATYITCSFELAPDKLRSLEREIKHENDVIRHLLIVKDAKKEKLTLTAEDIAATEDIEKVVGGEKSFEAIEGETEESKDLMAVRGEDAEAEDTSNKISDLGSSLGRDGQDTNKSQISNSETPEKEIEEAKEETVEAEKELIEIIEKKPEVKEKIEIKEVAKKSAVKKTDDKKTVIASQPKAAKQSIKKIATAEDDLAMTDDKKVEVKKVVKKKAVKKDDSVSDEADRLAKLNQELDDILGEDL